MAKIDDLARAVRRRERAVTRVTADLEAAIEEINGRLPEDYTLSFLRSPQVHGGMGINIGQMRILNVELSIGGYPVVIRGYRSQGMGYAGVVGDLPTIVTSAEGLVQALCSLLMSDEGLRMMTDGALQVGMQAGIGVPIGYYPQPIPMLEDSPSEVVAEEEPPEPVWPDATKPSLEIEW